MNLRGADRAALIARLPAPLLAFAAVTSILLAAVVLIFPGETATSLGFEADAQGRIEVRATFAGFFGGCGLFLAAAYRDIALRPAALLFLALGAGGAAAARLIGFLAEGTVPLALAFVFLYEIAITLLAALAIAPARSALPRA
ncbi:MAG: DUF4345 family protein [Pseudomonadota bacterium]